ncbi:GNAT family N-acetyltransferase [bacterium]|nr:GNAT family N-acetyltransferase [bacterium]
MRIEPLSTANLKDGVYCAAEKPNSNEIYEQLEVWLESNMLRGLVARDNNDDVTGFVLYYPIESAPLDVEGEGLYMVQCLFVKPDCQAKGVGRMLVEGAVADARTSGASGLAVEGYKKRTAAGYDFMPAAFFRHLGMVEGDSRDQGTLYYFSFDNKSCPTYAPMDSPKVKIDIIDCRRCYVGVSDRKVVDVVMDSHSPDEVRPKADVGQARSDEDMSNGVFVDGKLTYFTGPISEKDVLEAIEAADSAHDRSMDR